MSKTTDNTATEKCVLTERVVHDPRPIDQFLHDIASGEYSPTVDDTIACTLLDGREVDFVVTDVDGDTIRFESRDCLGEYVPMTRMNKYLARVWELLPASLRDVIFPTERRHFDRNGEIKTTEELLFLPAASEIFSERECNGDRGLYEQMEWYKDRRHRMRMFEKGGTPDWYWTSSRYSGTSTYFASVGYNGGASYANASFTYIAAPVCFRIRKS